MYRLLLGLCLFIATSGYAQDGFNIINSLDKTYSVKYPNQWTAKAEKYGENSFININAPGGDGIKVGVVRSPLPASIKTLDQLVAQQVDGIKKEMGVKTFSENKRVGNKHVLSFDFDAQGKKIKMKFYMWIDKGMMYSANYGGELLAYMANMGEAEAIVKSIGPAGNEPAAGASGKPDPGKAISLVDIDCHSINSFSNLIARGPAGITPIEKYGSLKLSNNKDFQVEVSDAKFYTMEKEKKSIMENKVNVFQKYIVDEPNGIIYHSEVMSSRPEYHFKYFLNTENGSYFFQDTKGPLYDLNAVKTMYQAAKESRVSAKGNGQNAESTQLKQSETATSQSAPRDNHAASVQTAGAVVQTAAAATGKPGVAAVGAVAAGALGKLGKNKPQQQNEPSSNNGITANVEPENGPYEGRNESGELIEKGQFANGKKSGSWIRYTNGVVTSEIEYLNGKKHGTRTEYFNNGKKDFVEHYSDGKLDGLKERYSMSTGVIIESWNYKNGELDGTYKRMTDKGGVLEEGNYVNNKKEGMWKTYERDGSLKNTKMYNNGKLVE